MGNILNILKKEGKKCEGSNEGRRGVEELESRQLLYWGKP